MSEQVTEASRKPPVQVRLRPETALKYLAITTRMRWTDTEAADALCDEFMANHGISVTDATAPPNGSKSFDRDANAPCVPANSPAQQGEDMQSDSEPGSFSPPAEIPPAKAS